MKKVALILSPIVLLVAAVVTIMVGAVSVPAAAVWPIIQAKLSGVAVPEQWAMYEMTIWNLRLPRILMSLLAGSALAVCGAAFQSIFRNPICDPYILGISSGASLGAAVAIITGLDAFMFGIPAAALVGALLTLLLVIGIAFVGNRKAVETILLAGIALNFLISAVITLLMVLNQKSLEQIIFWTMGSFTSSSWLEVGGLLAMLLICGFTLFFNAKSLNILQLGTDTAQTSGVNVQRTTLTVLIAASLLIASAVACCGVVGFVGLIIPHIVRLIFGNNNRTVFTFSLFFGAFFCLLADTIARTIAAPAELPVGSITALVGAPYFIFLLLSKKKY
ncbi:MAG: iron ABC transporter permease [Bacteroidales bacterium]|nr:iron ABC transporter permease [Bacteroidales bacterium]